MNLDLSMKHNVVRRAARELARKELAPLANELDRLALFPAEAVEKMKALGYFGLQLPREWSGAGLDSLSYVLVIEEISRVCAGMGLMLSVHNSVAAYPLFRFGSEDQKRKFLPDLARGERIGAFCLTEPNAGSDASAVETTAVESRGGFVINGNKIFVTNGGVCGLALVFARTNLTGSSRETSVLIVETERRGCIKGPKEELSGMRANPVCPMIFNECWVPEENLLGRPGDGLRIGLASLDVGRVGIAAQALGIAQACLDASLQYARERIQFGAPIGHLQAVQSKIAHMAVEVEAARLLTYKAARTSDGPSGPLTVAASMAKLFSSEVAVRAATQGIQIHGGYGYTKAYAIE
jgi:butyryl-CoA dehydrogenase